VIKMRAKRVISNSFRIAWKDLLELGRDHLRLALLLIMPLFMMAMIGFIYPSGNAASLNNLPIGLVNQDSGFNNVRLPSQALITGLQQINNQTHMLKFSIVANAADIKSEIQAGQINGGIIIPSNFSSCIMCGKQGTLIIMTDQSNPTISQELQASLSTVFTQMGNVLAQEKVRSLSSAITANDSVAIVQPYVVKVTGVVSGNPSYFSFIAPGMIMMTVMTSVMTGLPAAISQERELGTMDGIMVSPVNRLSIIVGKALSQTARGMLQGFIIMALAMSIFGVVINGSVLLVIALMLLGVFSFVGLGIVITSIAKDQETAQMLMMTLVFPMMFLSGVFFPIQQMPWFMQDVSKFFPLTYAADAMRRVMVLGAGVSAISTDIIVMVVFGAVMLAVAVPLFRKMMAR
jgi:ABC-2 type transport system permease protein